MQDLLRDLNTEVVALHESDGIQHVVRLRQRHQFFGFIKPPNHRLFGDHRLSRRKNLLHQRVVVRPLLNAGHTINVGIRQQLIDRGVDPGNPVALGDGFGKITLEIGDSGDRAAPIIPQPGVVADMRQLPHHAGAD